MKSRKEESVPPPSPEMLAAYVDGEFEGNQMLLSCKRSIEDWLEQHPAAAADILAWRRLKQLWQATAPTEPPEAAWGELWSRLEPELSQPAGRSASRRRLGIWVRGIAAAAVLLVVSAGWLVYQPSVPTLTAWLNGTGQQDNTSVPQDNPANAVVAANQEESIPFEPFPVAIEEEVAILHVEGADTGTLVVGRLPLEGPLVLASSDEVFLNHFEPAVEDDMLPDVHMDEGSPMIWARLSREINKP